MGWVVETGTPFGAAARSKLLGARSSRNHGRDDACLLGAPCHQPKAVLAPVAKRSAHTQPSDWLEQCLGEPAPVCDVSRWLEILDVIIALVAHGV